MPFRNRHRLGDAASADASTGMIRGLVFFGVLVTMVAAAAVLPVILLG